MSRTVDAPGHEEILLQAAQWHGHLTSATVDASLARDFEDWKRADPAHALAYADVEIAYAATRAMAEEPEMLALRHEALGRVVSRRPRVWLRIAASVALICATGTGWFAYQRFGGAGDTSSPIAAVEPGLYRTGIGERLAVTLDDGSTATLNTQSRLRVAYNQRERRLVLESGQALFDVAKGQKRPFLVVAGDRTIVAHGTLFDVRLDARYGVRVALIEGEVSVENNAMRTARATRLKPKEILTVSAGITSVKPISEPERIVGWRDGMVVFENESLASAVDEMNRYTRQPIILGDPSLRALRVSGAFRTGESEAFIEALQMYFPMRIAERSPGKVVLARAR